MVNLKLSFNREKWIFTQIYTYHKHDNGLWAFKGRQENVKECLTLDETIVSSKGGRVVFSSWEQSVERARQSILFTIRNIIQITIVYTWQLANVG